MSDLIELAERIEKLEGPCREVDALIWLAVCPPDYAFGVDEWMSGMPYPPSQENVGVDMAGWLERVPGADVAEMYKVRAYTASLDAAMTLYVEVPERIPSCARAATAEALRQQARLS